MLKLSWKLDMSAAIIKKRPLKNVAIFIINWRLSGSGAERTQFNNYNVKKTGD